MNLSNNQIHLLKRPKKEGLGKAYLHGFQYALDNFNWQYLIQMDADFSHNPQDINRFLVELENTDCVIGSRHIPGAKLQYPWYRKSLSVLANFYSRTIFSLPVSDCTTGFKGYRRKVLEEIMSEQYYSNDYAFQNELLFYVYRHGFRMKEIPIVFEDRVRGKSKMRLSNVIEGALGMGRVRFQSLKVKKG